MARTHRLLDARMDMVLSYEDRTETIYNLELEFVDIFGRQRRHVAPISLPNGQRFQERISFTAMSTVNSRPGIVQRVDDMTVSVMVFGGSIVRIPRHKDHDISRGDVVCVIEHMNVINPEHDLEYVALKFPLVVDADSLRLQSINADVLDESGHLLYRLSADAILKRRSHAARMAT